MVSIITTTMNLSKASWYRNSISVYQKDFLSQSFHLFHLYFLVFSNTKIQNRPISSPNYLQNNPDNPKN